MRILVVDDDPGMRRLVCRLALSEFHVETIEADDGATALTHLLELPIDLVLLDLHMRVVDGIQTLEAIRRSARFATVPVLILTGRADEERVRRAAALGISGVLVKPFTTKSLRERLTPFLASCARTGEPARRAAVRLEVAPADRVLVVESDEVVRSTVIEGFSRFAATESADDEFAALSRCLARSMDVLYIGATSGLWSQDEFVRKLRSTSGQGRTRIIAGVPLDQVDARWASALYDAVIERTHVVREFQERLRKILAPTTLARLLLHSSSETIASWFDWLHRHVEALTRQSWNVTEWRALPADTRRVIARVDVQVAGLRRLIGMEVPVSLALQLASAREGVETDRISETKMTAVVEALAREWARQLIQAVGQDGLGPHMLTAHVGVAETEGQAVAMRGRNWRDGASLALETQDGLRLRASLVTV